MTGPDEPAVGRDGDLEKGAQTGRFSAGDDGRIDLHDATGVGSDAVEAPVGREQKLVRGRVDVQRIDQRRRLREIDEAARWRAAGPVRVAALAACDDAAENREARQEGCWPPAPVSAVGVVVVAHDAQ